MCIFADCKCKPVWEMNCVDGTSADMKGCPELVAVLDVKYIADKLN